MPFELDAGGGGTTATNITQVGGSAISEGQKTMANSFPVVLASDQSALPVTPSASASATGWSVAVFNTLSNTAQQVKASVGKVATLSVFTLNTSDVFLQLWNLPSASVTVGTTPFTDVFRIPASPDGTHEAVYEMPLTDLGISYGGSGISVAITTTATGGTAVATPPIVRVVWI